MENSANSKLFDKLYSKKLENVAIYNTHQFDYPKCSDDNEKQKVQLLSVATIVKYVSQCTVTLNFQGTISALNEFN